MNHRHWHKHWLCLNQTAVIRINFALAFEAVGVFDQLLDQPLIVRG